jgi:hypothetical protein
VSNDSKTGGPIAPVPGSPAPLEGQALNNFLQELFAGVTGLDGTMVRPSFQTIPPNAPTDGNAWMSFYVGRRPADTFPYVGHDPDGDGGEGVDRLQRHETLHVQCSFFDLGTNGLAAFYAATLRDGLAIAQNREPLTIAGMGLVAISEALDVPVIVKQRWMYRIDMEVVIRRQIDRTYPVRNLLSADGTLKTDNGITVPFASP